MSEKQPPPLNMLTQSFDGDSVRCGGCGSKLEAGMLQRVLQRLPETGHPRVESAIGDDAAILSTGGKKLVITTDAFRSMIDDPWVFGKIALQHSLNDIYAMGAEPVAALAIATVPYMAPYLMEQDLYLMMAGAVSILKEEGIALAGGHSAEGAELSLGFAVTGELKGEPLTKGGLSPGDALILTRRIGSGVLLAGQMQGRTRSRWVQAALSEMIRSNRAASECLMQHGVRSCTDVTGFGLLGHLWEMCDASAVQVRLNLDAIPLYEGALKTMAPGQGKPGVESSLQRANERILATVSCRGCDAGESRVRLLADPQTAGGLLAGVPESQAERCLQKLHDCGYVDACIIGWVTSDCEESLADGTATDQPQHWLEIRYPNR